MIYNKREGEILLEYINRKIRGEKILFTDETKDMSPLLMIRFSNVNGLSLLLLKALFTLVIGTGSDKCPYVGKIFLGFTISFTDMSGIF